MPIYLGSDNAIVIKDLYDPWESSGTGAYITSGTVSAQIKDTTGATPGSGTNIGSAITLSYYAARAGVAGNYWVGVIEEDPALSADTEVDVVVTATASSDRVFVVTKREPVIRRYS